MFMFGNAENANAVMFYCGFQHKTSINKKYIKDLLEIVHMLISTSNLHYFGYNIKYN